MIKNCEICGREFVAKRSTARFCSNRCRQRNARMRGEGYVFVGEVLPPDTTATMTDDEVSGIIQQAHITASDLSRASLYTPSPLCLKLKNVARKLEGALRGEGL